jgi:hypothetical protein
MHNTYQSLPKFYTISTQFVHNLIPGGEAAALGRRDSTGLGLEGGATLAALE